MARKFDMIKNLKERSLKKEQVAHVKKCPHYHFVFAKNTIDQYQSVRHTFLSQKHMQHFTYEQGTKVVPWKGLCAKLPYPEIMLTQNRKRSAPWNSLWNSTLDTYKICSIWCRDAQTAGVTSWAHLKRIWIWFESNSKKNGKRKRGKLPGLLSGKTGPEMQASPTGAVCHAGSLLG